MHKRISNMSMRGKKNTKNEKETVSEEIVTEIFQNWL